MATSEPTPTTDDPDALVPERPHQDQPWWRRLLPFVLGAGLVAWVLSRVDWDAFTTALGRVNHLGFIAFVAGLLLALLAADSFATVHVYRRTVPQLRFGPFFLVRGASYLPSLLNHHLGQAWLTWLLARAYRIDLRRMAGATLLVYATWAGCLLLLASAAFISAGYPAIWVVVILGAGLAYLLLLFLKPKALAETRLLAPLFDAGVSGHLTAMITRIPHVVVLFVGTWVPFLFFGVEVPLSAALIYVPVLMVVVTLPLTPLGVGTRDALAATFFAQYVNAPTEAERLAAVAASTTTVAVTLVVLEAALGLVLLRSATRRIEIASTAR
ncbi:MAG: flippase-like domain-containing protein [Myxococcales bacterium]|nr:flippase-like domain-containing protein [Myxococcales bacterium]